MKDYKIIRSRKNMSYNVNNNQILEYKLFNEVRLSCVTV